MLFGDLIERGMKRNPLGAALCLGDDVLTYGELAAQVERASGAFLRAGVIDRILAYVAPILLGGPITAVDDVGVLSIAHAQRWRFDGIEPIGPDVRLSLVPN